MSTFIFLLGLFVFLGACALLVGAFMRAGQGEREE